MPVDGHGMHNGHITYGYTNYTTDLFGFSIGLSALGEDLAYQFEGVTFEIYNHPQLYIMSQNETYKEATEAIEERIQLEKNCYNKDCSSDYIAKNSKKFSAVFPEFPSLNQQACKYSYYNQTLVNEREEAIALAESNDTVAGDVFPYYAPCRINVYDVFNCPIAKVSHLNESSSVLLNYCNPESRKDKSLAFLKTCNGKDGECLPDFIKENAFYPYNQFPYEFAALNARYSTYKGLPPFKGFDCKATFNQKIRKMVNYENQIITYEQLPTPKVDVTILFGAFETTIWGEVLNKNQTQTRRDMFYAGGDGSVSSSNLIGALKWLYDVKKISLMLK